MFDAVALKSAILRSPLGEPARRVRWLLRSHQRRKHPELWETYLEEERTPVVLERIIRPDWRCIDVGAHLGSFLEVLLKLAPHGHHVAFEPSALRCPLLAARFPQVEIHRVAIGECAGSASFYEDRTWGAMSRILPSADASQTHIVEVRSLDEMLAHLPRVDFIKLDIEGYELPALRGGRKIISRDRPIVLMECGGDERMETFDFVTGELGYELYTLGDFLFDKGPLSRDEFRKCGIYPFRAFNYLALPP